MKAHSCRQGEYCFSFHEAAYSFLILQNQSRNPLLYHFANNRRMRLGRIRKSIT